MAVYGTDTPQVPPLRGGESTTWYIDYSGLGGSFSRNLKNEGGCFGHGQISALLGFISIFDFDDRFCSETPLRGHNEQLCDGLCCR